MAGGGGGRGRSQGGGAGGRGALPAGPAGEGGGPGGPCRRCGRGGCWCGGGRGGGGWLLEWWVGLRRGDVTGVRVWFPPPPPPPPWVLVWVGNGQRATSDGVVGVVGGVAM